MRFFNILSFFALFALMTVNTGLASPIIDKRDVIPITNPHQDPQPKPEPKPNVLPPPVKPQPAPQPKPLPPPQHQPEPKPLPKPEPEPQPQPHNPPQIKPFPQPQPQIIPNPYPMPKPEPQTQPKPIIPAPQIKPSPQPEPKPLPVPIPKPEPQPKAPLPPQVKPQPQSGSPKNKDPWTQNNEVWWGIELDGTEKKGRPGVEATNIMNSMFNDWKLPMYLYQIDQSDPRNRQPSTFSTPTVEQFYQANVSDGANFFFGCDDQALYDAQDKFNRDIYYRRPSNEEAIITIVWGTYGKMSYLKDGVLGYFCGLIAVECPPGSGGYFPTCKGLKTRLLQDTTERYMSNRQNGMFKYMGEVHSVKDIDNTLISFGKSTNQKLTLTDGTLTP